MTNLVAGAVYLLGALTCAACAVLLARGYMRSRSRLLMWSAICFTALGLDNVILFFDLIVFPEKDLALWRHSATLLGLCILVFGLVWDSE